MKVLLAALLAFVVTTAVAQETAEDKAAFVALVCTPENVARNASIPTEAACLCAVSEFVDRYGVKKSRSILLGEMTEGMTPDDMMTLAEEVRLVVPEVDALCGTAMAGRP